MIKHLVWSFVAASMVLIGCKKPDSSVGVDSLPNSDSFILDTDTLDVDIVTVRENTLDSKQRSTALLGRVFHPRIGETNAFFANMPPDTRDSRILWDSRFCGMCVFNRCWYIFSYFPSSSSQVSLCT